MRDAQNSLHLCHSLFVPPHINVETWHAASLHRWDVSIHCLIYTIGLYHVIFYHYLKELMKKN